MRSSLLLLLLSACIIDAPTFRERDGGADPIDASSIDADPDGTPGNAVLATDQAPYGFGDVAVDDMSAPLDVIVVNTGTDPSGTLDVTLTGADPGQFEIVDAGTTDCDGATLEPDATCTARVRFHPTAAGAQAATLEISASPGGSASVDLTGNGLSAGQLEITAGATLAFSTIEIQSSQSMECSAAWVDLPVLCVEE